NNEFDDIARRASDHSSNPKQAASVSDRSTSRRRRAAARNLQFLARRLATFCMAVVAMVGGLLASNLYNAAPLPRDGSVRVQVANVAPEISGKIKELRVVDNQFVHEGDVLYVIEPFDFNVALRSNKATLQQKIADRHVKDLQAQRRMHLSDLAASVE